MSRSVARIAIVGAASRLAVGRGGRALLQAIDDSVSPFRPVPIERFDPSVFAHDWPEGRPCQVRGALLDDYSVDFRALRLPPMAAEKMHRMERVALATMTEALTDAGITSDREPLMNGRILLAAGGLGPDPMTDHGRRIRRFELASPVSDAVAACLPDERATIEEYVEQLFNLAAPPVESDSMATSASVLAGRIANLFDFRGGHFAIDVGAGSSLAALEEAVTLLRAGDADVVLVCGISPLLSASMALSLAHRDALGASEPRPFASDADGTSLGEGCVALVLRREEDASGRVIAFVEGVGHSMAASTSASVEADSAAVARATRAALDDACVAETEVHACFTRTAGIPKVDRTELDGLARAYVERMPALRSVVPQTGHLGAAGGLAALLAAATSLQAGRAPFGPEHAVLPRDARVAVSDAGLCPVAYHAILAAPASRAHERTPGGTAPPRADDSIAIVGVGAIVPGGRDADAFFRNVVRGAETFDDLPGSRWDAGRLLGASRELSTILTTRLAGAIDRAWLTPERVGISAAAIEGVDPSVALALAAGSDAIRDARGAVSSWDESRVAVLVGQLPMRERELEAEKRVLFAGHLRLVADAMREASLPEASVERVVELARRSFDATTRSFDAATFDAFSGIDAATRLARRFGFTGGVACIDAACASSLVALDVARRRLADGELDAVLVGGVAANLLPEYYIALGILGFLSPEGHAPFDERSNGFVPAESAAFVVLRRTSDAVAGGERILATLRSIGLSSDGRTSSVFAPSSRGQRLSIERALAAADVPARSIEILEAHGAGTRLGDRTEMQSYLAAYGERDASEPLSIGTVKSSIGHTSSASGLVSLVKMVKAIEARILPPSRLPERLDEELGLDGSPLELASVARAWPAPTGRLRRAAISAFGLGGMNAHAILEEPATSAPREPGAFVEPATGLSADRFAVELVPVTLPDRPRLRPVAGRRALILRDAGDLHRALAAALERRGATVTIVDDEGFDRLAVAEADLVLDLGELGRRDARCLDLPVSAFTDTVQGQFARLVSILRAVYDRLSDAPPGSVSFTCVTSLGGSLGIVPSDLGDPLGGAVLGLLKGLKQELRHAHVKAIDVALGDDVRRTAEQILDELEDGNDRMEVALRGTRWVANLRRASFDADAPLLREIRPGDVHVFSGGGRGVAFECATALAALGARVIVTGRTPVPPPSTPWLSMDAATFDEHRKRELARRRAADRTLTPARFAEEFDAIVRQRELCANLERARRHGLSIEYEVCDVTDVEDLRACLARVHARYGRVDAVAHAAMVEWSRSLPRKTDEDVRRTVATKVVGIRALFAAIEELPIRAVIAFGSGAGRFGNRGQVDYAGANAAMAALVPRLAARMRRPIHATTLDWTAWSGVGAAVANPDVAALVRATGVTSIHPDEGRYWYVSELLRGRADEVVVFDETMLAEWPFLGSRADGEGERRIHADDRGELFVPGEWPMIDLVVERTPKTLEVERQFELPADAFLDQHRLHGVPIVPATFGLEMLAEAAALFAPGYHLHRADDVRIGVPLKLFHEKPLRVTIRAREVDATRDARFVEVDVRSTLAMRGRTLGDERVHVRGRFELRRGERPSPAAVAPLAALEGASRHARSFFHLAEEPVRLGPLFCNAHGLFVGEKVVLGSIQAPPLRALFRRTKRPRFQIDPMVLDASFQIAANWDGRRNGWVSIPFGVESVHVLGERGVDEVCTVLATVRRVVDVDVHYDLDVRGEGSRPLLDVRGLHLRRIAPLGEPA